MLVWHAAQLVGNCVPDRLPPTPTLHYTREEHHWRFKTPFHWRILNRHNQLGSDKLITSLPVMPNRQ
jgi:hypothetical protein